MDVDGVGGDIGPPVDDFLEEEEEDEDSLDEEEREVLQNIGEHPAMAAVQERYFEILVRKKDRAELEVREMEEAATRAKKEREDVGVELYGMQQQLVKLQMQLEAGHNNAHLIADIRKKAETDLVRFREAYKERKLQVEEAEHKLDRAKQELDGINVTIRQVETYNDEMKGEIAVVRRETYAAEEAISKGEKAKQEQDLYIDRLNERFKALTTELALYESRIAAQRREAGEADAMLQEAVKEMESIQHEKKQLLQQWQSSLIGMTKRDEALQATQDALRKQKEAEDAMRAEETGYRKDMKKVQLEHAVLQERLDKEVSESTFLASQLQAVVRQRDALSERYGMLKTSLGQTDAEVKRLRTEADGLRAQIAKLDQDRQTVDRERQGLEAGYEANLSSQTTVQKAAKSLMKEKAKVVSRMHEKEAEKAIVENELARIKVDALNVEAHNAQLRQMLDSCNKELSDKDKLIEQYEMEIRQRNDSIEKKMNLVDRLNRKYEKLTEGQVDENLGPFEATIKNMSKQIESRKEESERLQRQWLADQTSLVDIANDVEDKAERAHDLESAHTLATQKRMRLDASIQRQLEEIKALRNAIALMHNDMVRLNTLISKNEAAAKRLAEFNFSKEKDFVVELQEMERESVRLEGQIASLKEEKAALLEDILEAERQVMQWEKKIALEKETQAALDPSVGMSEAADMEREIHRMKLRYESLQRDQEKLINEMKRAIDKRESIELRFKGRAKAGAGAPLTQVGLKKQVVSLKKALKAATVDVRGYEEALELKRKELHELEGHVDDKTRVLETVEAEAAALQRDINSTLYDKQRGVEAFAAVQRMLNRHEALSRGHRPPLSEAEAARVEDDLSAAYDTQDRVRMVISGLTEAHPGMGEVLDRVAQLLEI